MRSILKYIWGPILSLLIVSQVFGFMLIAGKPPTPAGGGDDCSGDLGFSIHFEGSDASDRWDPTTGTPAGCVTSGGDTVPTVNGVPATNTDQAHDGSYSMYIYDDQDYIQYTITSDDIGNSASGTFEAWVYWSTLAGNDLFRLLSSGSDYVKILVINTDELRIEYDTPSMTSANATTTSANIAINNWYKIVGKWRETGTPNLSIAVYNASETLLDSATNDTELDDFDAVESSINIGSYPFYGTPSAFYMDEAKAYTAWQ